MTSGPWSKPHLTPASFSKRLWVQSSGKLAVVKWGFDHGPEVCGKEITLSIQLSDLKPITQ